MKVNPYSSRVSHNDTIPNHGDIKGLSRISKVGCQIQLILIAIAIALLLRRIDTIRNNSFINQSAINTVMTCMGQNQRKADFSNNISHLEIGWRYYWLQGLQSKCLGDEKRTKDYFVEMMKSSDEALELLRIAYPYDYLLARLAVDLYKDTPEAYFWLGDSLVSENNEEGAILAYEYGLALDPTNGDAWFSLGQLYGSERGWEEALRAFDQTCIYRDRNKNGCPRAGQLYLAHGFYEQAADRYQRSLELIGYSWPPAEKGLIEALLALGRTEEAIPHLEILAESGDGEAAATLLALRK